MSLPLWVAAALLQFAPQQGDVLGQPILCDGQAQVPLRLIAATYDHIDMLGCGQVTDFGLIDAQHLEAARSRGHGLGLAQSFVQRLGGLGQGLQQGVGIVFALLPGTAQRSLQRQCGRAALLLARGQLQQALWGPVAAHQLVIALFTCQCQRLFGFGEALRLQQPLGQFLINLAAHAQGGVALRGLQSLVTQHALLDIDGLFGVVDGLGHALGVDHGLGNRALGLPLPVIHILGHAYGPGLGCGMDGFFGVVVLAQMLCLLKQQIGAAVPARAAGPDLLLQQGIQLTCVGRVCPQASCSDAIHAFQIGISWLGGHCPGLLAPALQFPGLLQLHTQIDELIDIPGGIAGSALQIGHQLLGQAHGQGGIAHGARQIGLLEAQTQTEILAASAQWLWQRLLQLLGQLQCQRVARIGKSEIHALVQQPLRFDMAGAQGLQRHRMGQIAAGRCFGVQGLHLQQLGLSIEHEGIVAAMFFGRRLLPFLLH